MTATPSSAPGGDRPRVGSLFSGVEGFGLGLEAAGFEVAWQVEIDKDAVSVLERHYPTVRRYRDVREVKGNELPAVDVLVGGFPCQDLSVAGARKGLAGERSGLFFEVTRIAAESATPWLLLENVDGLLSQWTPVEAPPSGVAVGTEWEVEESADLGVVLATLQEHGYLGCLRVLDAQYFGVPQHRERVFIVAHLGGTGERALEVLLEPESVLRDLAACIETRQGTAAVPADGAGDGGRSIAPTLRSSDGGASNADNFTLIPSVAAEGGNRTSGPLDVATACTAHGGSHGRLDFESDTFIVGVDARNGEETGDTAMSIQAGAGEGRGVSYNCLPLIASSVQAAAGHHGRSSPRGDGSDNLIVAAPLTAGGHPNSNAPGRHREDDVNLVVAAFHEAQITNAANRARVEPGLPTPTLNGDARAAIAFDWQKGGGGNDFSWRGKSREWIERAGDYTGALSATKHDAIAMGMSVRRLMPVECERLMGWPEAWTARRADGSMLSDGARYRLIGNGVVAPVARWIGARLRRAMETT